MVASAPPLLVPPPVVLVIVVVGFARGFAGRAAGEALQRVVVVRMLGVLGKNSVECGVVLVIMLMWVILGVLGSKDEVCWCVLRRSLQMLRQLRFVHP
mmetsp:Transcript_59294/g.142859  ORF Transcript_59294/g.142859 Transcript_59294/m.142859 type:complete len:98 (+) Transcript_59294:692-985(+)